MLIELIDVLTIIDTLHKEGKPQTVELMVMDTTPIRY